MMLTMLPMTLTMMPMTLQPKYISRVDHWPKQPKILTANVLALVVRACYISGTVLSSFTVPMCQNNTPHHAKLIGMYCIYVLYHYATY